MQPAEADLVTCKYDVERKHALEQRLSHVRESLAAEHERRLDLAERLRVEQEDVERLEGMSFASFLATLRGIRDERLSAEREQYVAARLQHDGVVATVTALQAQAAEVEAELAALAGAEARYEAALAAREQQLLASDAPGRDALLPLVEELGTLRSTLRELDEAAAAADAADRALSRVAELLGKAAEWGALDLLGGGLIATALKHERIKEAGEAAAVARKEMQRLGTELSDAGMAAAGLEVELGEFAAAADFWLDGFLSDWLVQDRIKEARQRVETSQAGVHRIRDRVRAEAARLRERAAAVEADRRLHLEQV